MIYAERPDEWLTICREERRENMIDAVGYAYTRLLGPSAGPAGPFSAGVTGSSAAVRGCGATAPCCIDVLCAEVKNFIGPQVVVLIASRYSSVSGVAMIR